MQLLRTDNLPAGHKLIAKLDYLLFKDEILYIVASANDFYFIKKSPAMFPEDADEPGFDVFQTGFPRAAWMVDNIENKLWKSAAEGGLPSGTYFIDEDVDGENLKIRRTMHVGADQDKGFVLINFSRPHLKFTEKNFQEIDISDRLLLEGGLLDVLKQL
ncbi:hypothetical protein [Shewanella oncorhynchi]|uniref:hypothetical protein n=1 Tax=Shewanella oncorhynchi TaxID=2726434 RepID=UPI002E7ABA53|nr:hypothetical protein [Shewanella oncorhynchi]WVI95175.1 hypothetical protein VR487_09615 [Shewanella oncorhynchi]